MTAVKVGDCGYCDKSVLSDQEYLLYDEGVYHNVAEMMGGVSCYDREIASRGEVSNCHDSDGKNQPPTSGDPPPKA